MFVKPVRDVVGEMGGDVEREGDVRVGETGDDDTEKGIHVHKIHNNIVEEISRGNERVRDQGYRLAEIGMNDDENDDRGNADNNGNETRENIGDGKFGENAGHESNSRAHRLPPEIHAMIIETMLTGDARLALRLSLVCSEFRDFVASFLERNRFIIARFMRTVHIRDTLAKQLGLSHVPITWIWGPAWQVDSSYARLVSVHTSFQ